MARILEAEALEAVPARSKPKPRSATPSRVDAARPRPFTLDQELEPFADWVGEAIWAPPLDASSRLAESMLKGSRPFTPLEKRWESVVDRHRGEFTQVREVDLRRASIRLPEGRFYVSVTERKDFDKIEEEVPACVQTRLDEFLAGPGRRPGVKVYYLKPLCVEVCDHLVLTTRKDLMSAINKIKAEVFKEYRETAALWRVRDAFVTATSAALAPARMVSEYFHNRRQKAIDRYQAKLEFKRRKTALGATRTYKRCRTSSCTFNEMLSLTNPLKRNEVVQQYGVEKKLSRVKRQQLARMAAGSTPWFVTLAMAVSNLATLQTLVTVGTGAAPVVMCDPVFVAETPDSPGVLWKIGHFDEVGGVMHIEI